MKLNINEKRKELADVRAGKKAPQPFAAAQVVTVLYLAPLLVFTFW